MLRKLVWLSTAAMLAAAPHAHAQAEKPLPPPPTAKAAPAETATTVQGLTVTGQAQAPVRTAIDRRSYSVSGDLQAGSGSIGDALRNIPSVEVDVQGNLSLRGDANVTIMIDGKPSGMFKGAGRAMALQQLPADQIDRVEVMTNPSAAFDPDGSAGIINLVTKKGRGAGRSGSLRANLGDVGRRNAGVGFTYNSRKLALNGDLALRHDVQKNVISDRRTSVDPTTGAAIDSLNISRGRAAPDILTGHGTMDYDLDPTTRLSLALDANLVEFTAKPLETFEIGPPGGPLVRVSQRQGAIHFHNRNSQIGGTYRKGLPGQDHDITLNLDYGATTTRSTRPFVYALGPPAPGATFDDYHMLTELDHTQLKAEYRRPLPGDAKLTAGYQLQHDDNAFNNLDLRGPSQDLATPDPAFTDHFRYDQVINSIYGTYQRPIGDLTVLAGIRVEAVRRTTDQLVLSRRDTYDEVRAYPSLHLSYDLGEGRQFTAAYSHRVQRPNPQDLNPYRYYQDSYTYRAGNPLLRPQQTESYEFAYQYKKNGAVYLGTLYYRDNRDAFTDVVRALGGGVLLTTKENLGSSRAAGLELVANGKITPKLTYNISGSVYWTQIDAASLGFASERSITTAQGRANLNWQVTPKDLFQVNLLSNGRRLIPQGYREGWVSMNLGYRHKFDDRVAATVSLQDVFDGFQFHSRVDTPLLKENFDQSISFRGITVGVTYLFGDTKKAKRDPGFDFGGGSPTP